MGCYLLSLCLITRDFNIGKVDSFRMEDLEAYRHLRDLKKKESERVWTGFVWPWVGVSDGSEHCNDPSRFIKCANS
jgi:hypothetical protein